MEYYLPESQDYVDPGFDLWTGERTGHRVRGRTDQYAHEMLEESPFDGLLLSYALYASGRFTDAARHRLAREGMRRFYRLPPSLRCVGDCGAYAHRGTGDAIQTDALLDFYEAMGVDLGLAPDEAIMEVRSRPRERPQAAVSTLRASQRETLDRAAHFLAARRARALRFEPVGVVQGWDVASYLDALDALEKQGYTTVALGGLASARTDTVRLIVRAAGAARRPGTRLHLLGVSRTDDLALYAASGVASFDSTMPVRQAFKDDENNYHQADGPAFLALRVPELRGSLRLRARLEATGVTYRAARALEDAALEALYAYGQHAASLGDTVRAVEAYERLLGVRDHREAYTRLLRERPWEACSCALCRAHGIAMLLFRTAEHNKRRAMHNLHVFAAQRQRLRQARPSP